MTAKSPSNLNILDTTFIERGSSNFICIRLALFFSGLATFSLLYYIQPIMPALSHEFAISPAQASLSMSIATAMLAIGLLFTGPLSDTFGRKGFITVSLLLAAIFTLLSSLTTDWHYLLIMRALTGLALSGVVAVAMTYLSEEMHPNFIAVSIGFYVSGNAIGGMAGRFFTSLLTDLYSWRIATLLLGIFAFIAACVFWLIAPASRHFKPNSLHPKKLLTHFFLHWSDPYLPKLFFIAFALMGCFVTFFNYISYLLLSAPYYFNQTSIGCLSLTFLIGTISSPQAGAMTRRFGLGTMLFSSLCIMFVGLIITAFSSITIIFFGMLCFTAGFFASHAVASSWIGLRAKQAKGQASALYFFFFYLGSSTIGTSGGYFWSQLGWWGVLSFLGGLLLITVYIALYLSNRSAK